MSVELLTDINGFSKLRIEEVSGACAEVYLYGAHVTSWIPASGPEALFLSREAVFSPGTSIRGGVPVIFPQFAELGGLPKHGFARTHPWRWVDSAATGNGVTLELTDSEDTRRIWPHSFLLRLIVEVGPDRLDLRLMVENTGGEPFDFSGALHTYLRVSDIANVVVRGLFGASYLDRQATAGASVDSAEELAITGFVDRVYPNAPPTVSVIDQGYDRTLKLAGRTFADAVVWNPGPELAAKLLDLDDVEYREMLCVEAAQVCARISLAPEQRWQGGQLIEAIAGEIREDHPTPAS